VLDQLYKNGALRDQLVGAAPPVSDIAARVLPDVEKSAAVQASLTQMYTDGANNAVKAAGATAPAATGLKSEAAAEDWIRANVTDPAKQTAALNAFAKAMHEQRFNDA